MEITIKYQSENKWHDHAFDDWMTVTDVINKLSGNIPAIVMQGEKYWVNTKEWYDKYRNLNKTVAMIQNQVPSDKKFNSVGFGG